jgi:Na+/H+ antiporter NhaD/arsenite permease-like protein
MRVVDLPSAFSWLSGPRQLMPALAAGAIALGPASAFAAGEGPSLRGADLALLWALPFAGLLLSIAVMPLLAPRFWHHHYGKVSLFWALGVVLPMGVVHGAAVTAYELLHTALLEYVPFIILLLALFTITGGIRFDGRLGGTPAANTGVLGVGSILAGFMGTTGASMLLIRSLIAANNHRRHQRHVVIFFIFLVSNIGGALTPLGDPPLFLGFLQGVDFFWPTIHLTVPMLLVGGTLLAGFYLLDVVLYRRDLAHHKVVPPAAEGRVRIVGKQSFVLLAAVLAAVLLSGLVETGVHFTVYHVEVALQGLLRDLALLALVFLSLRLTSAADREQNGFSWFPIVEVAKLFAGIFVTIIPPLAILRAGSEGALAGLLAVLGSEGQPANAMYFWLTGMLSSFLDNAPTYLIFFNAAGGEADTLMGPLAGTLIAISCGAVFMGANTYIGNAPNFMVKSIAEASGVKMPSFFGYMVWSGALLLPVFILFSLVYF